MDKFNMKTYRDSYLYNCKISNQDAADPGKRNTAAIKDFIINSHRIEEKTSDSFRGILEEVKRQQRSSILVTILMMDRIKLCIGNSELPRAFKVFDAKDLKSSNQPAVFIDVTGLIEYKQGYYYCKRIDILCAYLMDALVYLLYRFYPMKLVDNSNLTLITSECYTSMFTYILDYLRVSGYAQNKNKICYFVALYFLVNMMGKEYSEYTKGIAGKVAGLKPNDYRAFDLYLEDDTFNDINSFVIWLEKTFQLKGLTLAIFIKKWAFCYGTGTQYASELYTSFVVLLLNAFSASYIVNQKQIERCCNMTNLVRLWNAVEKAGVSSFDNRGLMSESQLKIYEYHDKNSENLAEAIKMRDNIPSNLKFTLEDFSSVDVVKEKANNVIKYYKSARMEDKLDKVAENAIMTGIEAAYLSAKHSIEESVEPTYENGALIALSKVMKNRVSDRQRYNIETTINRDSDAIRQCIFNECYSDSGCSENKGNTAGTIISEFREMQKYI